MAAKGCGIVVAGAKLVLRTELCLPIWGTRGDYAGYTNVVRMGWGKRQWLVMSGSWLETAATIFEVSHKV